MIAPFDLADTICAGISVGFLLVSLIVAIDRHARRLDDRADTMRRHLHTGPDALFPEDEATILFRSSDGRPHD